MEKEKELQTKIQQLKDRNEKLEAHWEAEVDSRLRVEDTLHGVEGELKRKKRRMNRMTYAFQTSYDRLYDRMYHFPIEIGQTRHTISRDWMTYLLKKEEREALHNGLIG